MFIADKTLFLTSEELTGLIGPPKFLGDRFEYSAEQHAKFLEISSAYIAQHCSLRIDLYILCLHVPVMISLLVLLTTNEEINRALGLFIVPAILILAAFFLMIFRRRITYWLASKHTVMVLHVIKQGDEDVRTTDN